MHAAVPFDQFVAAASDLGRRESWKRATKKQPIDTLLYSDGESFVVSTPLKVQTMAMVGEWPDCVSLNAKKLEYGVRSLIPTTVLDVKYKDDFLILNNGQVRLNASIASQP